jgi:hypothetical protein
MDLTLQSKDIDFLIGSKSKIQQSVVYKKHTSQSKTQTKSERLEKHVPGMWKSDASRSKLFSYQTKQILNKTQSEEMKKVATH